MDDELKVKLWLIPIPVMACVGVVIAVFLLRDVKVLSFFDMLLGFGLPALLMFPFMWKYSEEYRKHFIGQG